MESLQQRKQPSKEREELRNRLIRGLLPKMIIGNIAVIDYLKSLSQDELFFLLDFSTEDLRNWLKIPIKNISIVPISNRYKPVLIPAHLPDGLKRTLEAYHDRVKTRYIRLALNGHSRDIKYVRRRMNVPIRLATFLNNRGIKMWGSLTSTNLTQFCQENPAMKVEKLQSFINYIEKKKRFNDGRGRGRRGRGRMGSTDTFPDVIDPHALSELIQDQCNTLIDIEYLAFWLVARMGLSAVRAYNFSLENITKNDEGKVVIRPNIIWVTVPKRVAALLELIAKRQDSQWPFSMSDKETKQYLFHDTFNYKYLTENILQKKAVLLRRSAIFSAMRRGHLDRVTLHQTMGVSMPMIVSLEQLLSTDLHRTLDRETVKKRNEYILRDSDG